MTVSAMPALPGVPGNPTAGDPAAASSEGSGGAFAGLLGGSVEVPGSVPVEGQPVPVPVLEPPTVVPSTPGTVPDAEGPADPASEDAPAEVPVVGTPVLTAAQIIAAAQVVPVAPLLAAAAAGAAAARTGGEAIGVEGATATAAPAGQPVVEGEPTAAVPTAAGHVPDAELAATAVVPTTTAGMPDAELLAQPAPDAVAQPAPDAVAPTAEPVTGVVERAAAKQEAAAPAPAPVSAPVTASVPVHGSALVSGGHDAPAQASGVTGQVFPEVSRLVSRGDGTQRITLKLTPEALGDVRVVLTVRGGEVHVRMAGGELAQQALLQGAPELHRLLEAAGATASRLEIGDARSTFDGGQQGRTLDLAQEQGTTDHQTARTRDGENTMATDGATGAVRTRPLGSTEPATRARTGVDVTM